MKKLIVLLVFSFAQWASYAQVNFKNDSGKPLTFKQMQMQFDEFKSQNDLKEKKGWKYYKRWEDEAIRHTMGNGELASPDLVNREYLKAAQANNSTNAKASQLNGTWLPEGPYNVAPGNELSNYGIGRINCIAYHPNLPGTYWVGVAQGGVWKTTDNGLTWSPLTDNLPILRISDIAVNPNNPDEIYIAVGDSEYIDFSLKLNGRKRNTHYGLGVYKTTDGGLNWQATGLSFSLNSLDASLTRKIIIHPTQNNKLVAATSNGLYYSNNSGATWTQALDSLCWDLIEDPASPNTLYLATGYLANSNAGYASIMKSTDFGVTWVQLNTGIPPTGVVQRIKLCMAPTNSNIIYALAVDMSRGMHALYKTTDAGANWGIQFNTFNLCDFYDGTGSGGQGTYDLVLMVSPTDENKVYAGGINIWGSVDGGTTFEPVTNKYVSTAPDIHVDQHFLTYNPITQNVFICNDGGIYRAPVLFNTTLTNLQNGDPFPTTWTNISAGLHVTSFYRVSSDKANTNRMIAGAQDNSTYYFDNGNWDNLYGGDGMDNYLDGSGNYICSAQFGSFYSSLSFSQFQIANAEWTAPVIYNDNTSELYFGGADVFSSVDFGATTNQISDFALLTGNFSEPPITSIAANGTTLYVTKRPVYQNATNAYCYVSNDLGVNWTDITAGLPDSLYFTSIEVNPVNPLEAWITVAGFEAGLKIFKTSDGGASWQNESYNLPNIPMNMIKCVDGNSKLLVVAADIGVYYKSGSSTTWQLYGTGLPNVIVSDIEVNPAANKMIVSTFGRGIWSTDLSSLIGLNDNAPISNVVKLFPSKNNGVFTIDLTEINSQSNVDLKVIDITGKVCLQKQLLANAQNQVGTKLLSGMYFAQITFNGKVEVRKFVVE